MLQRAAEVLGDFVRPLALQRVMVYHADADLLFGDDLAEGLEIHAARARRFEGDDVGIDLVQHLERVRVALYVLEPALPRRVAPARVAPDFGFGPQPLHRPVEDLDAESRIDHIIDD